jgi:heme exporter protein B
VITIAGGALTLGIRASGVVFGIVTFPLYIPVLIFGASWIVAQDSFNANMLLLLAMFIFMLPLGVLAATAAIKAAFEEG